MLAFGFRYWGKSKDKPLNEKNFSDSLNKKFNG
jgi:hypothetical protein